MSDLSLTPKAGLLALINQNTTAPAAVEDVQEFYPPEVIEDAAEGQLNTRITLKTTLDFSHAGRATFEYQRIDLSRFTPYGLTATVEDIGTLEQYQTMLTNRYGIYLGVEEIEPAIPFDVSGGELEYTLTFNAKPNALMYVGSGQFKVKVNWRFDDPEWIEQNINRLRVLLQNDLPLSILSFMNK